MRAPLALLRLSPPQKVISRLVRINIIVDSIENGTIDKKGAGETILIVKLRISLAKGVIFGQT